MTRLGIWLLAALLGAGGAQAATVTIDFDELDDDDYDLLGFGEVDNFNYQDQNWGRYGTSTPFLLLSDDGYTSETAFTADPGTYFTPVAMDLGGSVDLKRAPCEGCTPEEAFELQDLCSSSGLCEGFVQFDDFDYLRITGYRDGVLVASDAPGRGQPAFSGRYEFGAAFRGVSEVRVELDFGPEGGFPEPETYVYACGTIFFSECVSGGIDNLTVETNVPPVAPVPLPASVALLAGGLGLLGIGAARQRR